MNNESGGRVVAILAYHKVGPPPAGGWDTWFYVPAAVFRQQLEYLVHAGWDILDLATFMRGIGAAWTLPRRSALLTFDDGYRSTRTVVLPVLRDFGFPAVMFVPTNFIGRTNSFDESEPKEEICDASDLQALEESGIAVQSHGTSHTGFSYLDPDTQAAEAIESKQRLEEVLKRPVTFFSYPYGDWGKDPDQTMDIIGNAGYDAACVYKGGLLQLPTNQRFALPRIAMGADTDLAAELGAVAH